MTKIKVDSISKKIKVLFFFLFNFHFYTSMYCLFICPRTGLKSELRLCCVMQTKLLDNGEGQFMFPIDLLFIFCIKLYIMIKYDKNNWSPSTLYVQLYKTNLNFKAFLASVVHKVLLPFISSVASAICTVQFFKCWMVTKVNCI